MKTKHNFDGLFDGLSISELIEVQTELVIAFKKLEHEVIVDKTIPSKAHSNLIDAITYGKACATRLRLANELIESSFLRK